VQLPRLREGFGKQVLSSDRHIHTYLHTYIHTYIQTNRQTDRQTVSQMPSKLGLAGGKNDNSDRIS